MNQIQQFLEQADSGINYVDIGCGGYLDYKFDAIRG